MNTENKNDKRLIIKGLENLLNSLEEVSNISEAAMYGSQIENKSKELVASMMKIVKIAPEKNFHRVIFDDFVKEIESLAQLIMKEKAKVPLISDELVITIEKAVEYAIEIQVQMKGITND